MSQSSLTFAMPFLIYPNLIICCILYFSVHVKTISNMQVFQEKTTKKPEILYICLRFQASIIQQLT